MLIPLSRLYITRNLLILIWNSFVTLKLGGAVFLVDDVGDVNQLHVQIWRIGKSNVNKVE